MDANARSYSIDTSGGAGLKVEYTVEITGITDYGHESTATLTFTVDKSAPTVSTKTPTGTGASIDSYAQVTFTKPMADVNMEIVGTNVVIQRVDASTWRAVPFFSLQYETAYTVRIISGNDTLGHALDTTSTSWTFTTSQKPSLTGRVMYASGQVAIEGASVTISGTSGTFTDSTDSNGRFDFLNLPTAGTYTLSVSYTGYDFDPITVAVQAERPDIGIVYSKISTLSGIVKDVSGNPVADATVTLSKDGQLYGTTTTGSDGRYAFDNLPKDVDFQVTVVKAGMIFDPVTKRITTTGKATDLALNEVPAVDFENKGKSGLAIDTKLEVKFAKDQRNNSAIKVTLTKIVGGKTEIVAITLQWSGDGRTATLVLQSGSLDKNAEYEIAVTGLEESKEFSFQTGSSTTDTGDSGDGDGNSMLLIVGVVAVVAIIGGAFAFLRFRKK